MERKISIPIFADILGTSKRVVQSWVKSGKISVDCDAKSSLKFITKESLEKFPECKFLFENKWDSFTRNEPLKTYNIIELFAGCGGLALGLEGAGFKSLLVNEIEKDAANTLKLNRPNWNIVNEDIAKVSFKDFHNKIDMVSGGFPCQAFSYAGNKLGFDDTRGTLFYEFARTVQEVNPKIFVAENVKGLLSHDNGRTFNTIRAVISELGYTLVGDEVCKAIFHRVPQ